MSDNKEVKKLYDLMSNVTIGRSPVPNPQNQELSTEYDRLMKDPEFAKLMAEEEGKFNQEEIESQKAKIEGLENKLKSIDQICDAWLHDDVANAFTAFYKIHKLCGDDNI